MSENNVMKDLYNKITSLKEEYVTYLLVGIIFVIIIFCLCYYLMMRTYISRKCSTLDDMYSTINGKIASLNASDPKCQHFLRDYYIKTSYNSCSIGTYKNSFVSICILKDLLKQGVRGLDFEIYSIDNEPVVATSTEDSYFIKETYNYVPFLDVMNTIVNYAFANSTSPNPRDPIILHLRIKSTNQNMYTNLASIFKEYDQFFLGPDYSFENGGKNVGEQPIMSLSGKIILIVDRLNNAFMDNSYFYEYVNMTSNSIFMRGLRFYDVKNTPDIGELQEYNKKNMTIVIPDNGVEPDNPNPVICQETGCQMTAIMYQKYDVNLQMDNSLFDKIGYAFVLKPERLRYIPITIDPPVSQDQSLTYQTRTVTSDYYSFNI
jgi:hypothetical protein